MAEETQTTQTTSTTKLEKENITTEENKYNSGSEDLGSSSDRDDNLKPAMKDASIQMEGDGEEIPPDDAHRRKRRHRPHHYRHRHHRSKRRSRSRRR